MIFQIAAAPSKTETFEWKQWYSTLPLPGEGFGHKLQPHRTIYDGVIAIIMFLAYKIELVLPSSIKVHYFPPKLRVLTHSGDTLYGLYLEMGLESNYNLI